MQNGSEMHTSAFKFYSVSQFLHKFVTIFSIIPTEKVFLVFGGNEENKMHSNSWKRKAPIGREVFVQKPVMLCYFFKFLFLMNFLFNHFLLAINLIFLCSLQFSFIWLSNYYKVCS